MSHLVKDRIWVGRTVRSVSRPEDVVWSLKTWERNLRRTVARPPILKPPRNFSATSQRGGIQLSWRPDSEAVGYEIVRSLNGDFSEEDNANIVVLTVIGGSFSSFFDGVSGSGASTAQKRYYRMRSLSSVGSTSSGPSASPDDAPIRGVLTGVVSVTSIDPTDTATASVTARDDFASDPSAAP